jgi:hypothetical protein
MEGSRFTTGVRTRYIPNIPSATEDRESRRLARIAKRDP